MKEYEDSEEVEEWEQIFNDPSLTGIFSEFPEGVIIGIAEDKGIEGISGCKKESLIDKLVKHMLKLEVLESYFLCLQDREIEYFEQIIVHHKTEQIIFEIECLQKLYKASYVGVGMGIGITIPEEVSKQYQRLKGEDFTHKRKKLSFLLCTLRTAGMLYGITPIDILQKMIETNTEIKMTKQEIWSGIRNLPPEFADYIIEGSIIYKREFYSNERGLLEVQGDEEYYIPTMKEILDIGMLGCIPDNEGLLDFKRYLEEWMNVPTENARLISRVLQSRICSNCGVEEVILILENGGVKLENECNMNELMMHVRNFWNHTRMIVHRGFTPDEIEAQNNFKVEVEAEECKSSIIDFNSARKKK